MSSCSPSSSAASLRHRVARSARHLTVGAASLAIVASAGAYALTPAVDSIAATTASVASASGKEAIKGQVLRNGHGATRTVVRIFKLVNHHQVMVAKRKVGANGRFSVTERPGNYVLVLKNGHARKRLSVRVRKGQSVFVGARLSTAGGLMFGPVIFNY